MNAAEQEAIAERLDIALRHVGLRIEGTHPNCFMCWARVPAEAILGHLLRRGWKVSIVEPEA